VFRERHVAAVVPAYNEERLIAGVIRNMPPLVDHIIVIDDKSLDGTAAVAEALDEPRVVLIRHAENQGLGGALVSGYKRALSLHADLVVVMAGDDQMDPRYLPDLLEPLCDGRAEATKGNRFYSWSSLRAMPKHRVFGSLILTWLTRIASGHRHLADSQNGYVAFTAATLEKVRLGSLSHGYSVENAMLIELGRVHARVIDVPIPARYGSETSKMRLLRDGPAILGTILTGVAQRITRSSRR